MGIGHSYRSAAAVMGKSYGAVRSYCQYHEIKSHATGPVELTIPAAPSFDQHPQLSGDFVVVCDVHAPATDWLLASRAAMIGRKYLQEPRRLLVVGDLMNYEAFSKFDALVAMPSLQTELESARAAVRLWRETFSEIVLTFGNHDYRWVKSLLGAYPEDTVLDLFYALLHNPNGLTVSIAPYSTVETITGLWHLSHLNEYAQTPLMKARKVANRHKDRHVALAHEHHIGQALDESGRFMLMDLPCLCDPDKLAYIGLGDSSKPVMKRGFGMIRNGTGYLFSDNPAWTDWGFWLE